MEYAIGGYRKDDLMSRMDEEGSVIKEALPARRNRIIKCTGQK